MARLSLPRRLGASEEGLGAPEGSDMPEVGEV